MQGLAVLGRAEGLALIAPAAKKPPRQLRRPRPPRAAAGGQGSAADSSKASQALRALDALLPQQAAAAAAEEGNSREAAAAQGAGHEWWDRPSRQRGPLRKVGTQGGESGDYLDSEAFTRDPNRLSTGDATPADAGGALSLPTSQPRLCYVLAALPAAAAALVVLMPASGSGQELWFSSSGAASGAYWQLLTSSLVPLNTLNLAACCITMGTAGGRAERVLGGGRLVLFALLPGASKALLFWARSLPAGVDAVTCGPGASLLGLSGALAAYLAANWRVLSSEQRGSTGVAAAALAAACLTELPLLDVSYLAAVGAGLLLGTAAGPKLQVVRELDIPEGSLTVPADCKEVEVVVDEQSSAARILGVGAAYTAVLLAAAALCSLLGGVPEPASDWVFRA